MQFFKKSIVVFLVVTFALTAVKTSNAQSYQSSSDEIVYASGSNASGLSRTKPSYFLDSGDVLGIFVEGVLGEKGSNPPIQYPDAEKNMLPAMGYPVAVRENGTISLPLIKPISMKGFTIQQAEELVKQAYYGNQILNKNSRIIVTLMRKRTVSITVIRQDNSLSSRNFSRYNSQPVTHRSDRSARAKTLQLPAGENTVLQALIETGGIPGVNAGGIQIYRDNKVGASYGTPGYPHVHQRAFEAGTSFPRSQSSSTAQANRHHVQYRPSDSSANSLKALYGALREGDVVNVESRPTEVFYTGGLLRGGEYALPRDKTLDVLEAVSIAGGSVGANDFGTGRVNPSSLVILRKTPGGQVRIPVDLKAAVYNPALRYQIMPGDYLLLSYTPQENATNFGLRTYQTYGLRQLIR